MIVEYRETYFNKIIFSIILLLKHIPRGREKQKKAIYNWDKRKKTDKFMIEIFETSQTKSIAKQTNRDESLIFRCFDNANRKGGAMCRFHTRYDRFTTTKKTSTLTFQSPPQITLTIRQKTKNHLFIMPSYKTWI